MSKRTIKFEVSEETFRKLEEQAKREGQRSVAQLSKDNIDKILTAPSASPEPFFHLGTAKAERDRDLEEQRRRKYWANKKKPRKDDGNTDMEEGSKDDNYQTSGARKLAIYDYFLVGDRAYLLWYSSKFNARMPSIGLDSAFWIHREYTNRPNYHNISESLSEFEIRWLEAWVENFETMNSYWWFVSGRLTTMNTPWELSHLEEMLTWLDTDKSIDELYAEMNLATRPILEKIEVQRQEAQQQKLEAITDLAERQRVADIDRYHELERIRGDLSEEARKLSKEQMNLGLKHGLIKPKRIKLV